MSDSELALVDPDQALRDRAWELHLTGASFTTIAREVSATAQRSITYHAVSRWIAQHYEDLGNTPAEKVDQLRRKAVQRLSTLTRKGFKALEAYIPSDEESAVGFQFDTKSAPSVARILEVLTRLEEVRARIEGTIAVGHAGNTGTPDGGSGIVEQRWIIVRRDANTGDERSIELGLRRSGIDPLAIEPGDAGAFGSSS